MEKAPLRHVNGLSQCLGLGCPISTLKMKTNPSNKTKLVILSRELPNELKVPFSKLFFFFFFRLPNNYYICKLLSLISPIWSISKKD